MCLSIPGKLIEKEENKFVIDYGNEKRIANLSVVDDLKIGDYVFVSNKIIINKIDEKEAKEFLGRLKHA